MVQAKKSQNKMANIIEAKTFLVARAAKNVYQKVAKKSPMDIYKSTLQKEFENNHIMYKQPGTVPQEKNRTLFTPDFPADFFCFGNLLVKIKDGQQILDEDCAKLKVTLRKMDLPAGLIINFSHNRLNINRVMQ